MDATTISFGSFGGEILTYVVAGLAPVIAGCVINWLVKAAARLNVQIAEERRAKLQEMVENGIKAGAQKIGVALDGKLSIDVKSELIAGVVNDYLPQNAAETVKALGGNVHDTAAMTDVVAARSADVLALPAQVRALAEIAGTIVPAVAPALPARKAARAAKPKAK